MIFFINLTKHYSSTLHINEPYSQWTNEPRNSFKLHAQASGFDLIPEVNTQTCHCSITVQLSTNDIVKPTPH